MPELPEVETIKRVLEPQIKDRYIDEVIVNNPQVISRPDMDDFCSTIKGQRISGMARRGKFLSILLQHGDRIILHLRMTGGLLLTPQDYPVEKHTHVIFKLDNNTELRFSDSRRFGRFWLLKAGEEDEYSGAEKLGLEPFDEALTAEYLKASFGKSRRAIKDCLLDQRVVAGIGNIYSDEFLFTARIRPNRAACTLTDQEWENLAEIVSDRMAYFIEKNAISPEDYLMSKGKDYRNTPFLQVYGHKGEPCPVCGDTLCKTIICGRSSVYCPSCQQETLC